MDYISIVIIAIGLAMDAFAVSMAAGVSLKYFQVKPAFRVALFFGFFQAIMPYLGWLAGSSFSTSIASIDHWVVFFILLFIGGKMIYESFVITKAESSCDPNNIVTVFLLAIATSIDALAVGISFSLLNQQIIEPIIIIGLVTFILSLFGVYIGSKIGSIFENKIELLGGIILIAIGTKILLEHLMLF